MVGSTIKVVATAESGNTFESDETAEVAEPTIALIDVDQISANKISVTFDNDAESEGVTKDDITISQLEDGVATLTIPVNSIEWTSEDGTEALLTLAQALTDGATYEVSYEDSDVEFEASVGEVAEVIVLTATAQQNVETPIEFVLLDENGVDVTSSVKIAETLSFNFEGSYSTVNPSPTKPTITMATVGDEATVVVTYNSNKSGAEDVEGKGEIVCVDAQAVVGAGIFKAPGTAALKQYSDGSECAKFYIGAPDTVASATVDGSTDVFFCALDDAGDVLDYTSYDVESSNDDIVNVSMKTGVDTGKFCAFEISGVTVGTANINVKATKNGKDTYYRVPVVITEKGEFDSITVTPSRVNLSNAIDEDYYGTLTVKAFDSNGVEITPDDITYKLIDDDKKGGSYTALDICADVDTGAATAGHHGFAVDDAGKYTAWGDKGGSYTIKVEVAKNGIVKTKNVTIPVRALPAASWYGNNTTGADVVYQIELGANTIDEVTEKKGATTAKLYATIGDLFAGYVRTNGAIGTGAPAGANDGKRYTNETTATPATGTLKFTASVNDVEVDGATETGLKGATITFAADPAKDGAVEYKDAGDPAKKLTFTDATAAGVLNAYKLNFATDPDAANAGIAVDTAAKTIVITADFSTAKGAADIAKMLTGSSKLALTVNATAEATLDEETKPIATAVRALKVAGDGTVKDAAVGDGVVFQPGTTTATAIAGFVAAKVTKTNGVAVEADAALPNIKIYFKGTVTVADIQKAIKDFVTANADDADATPLAYITVGGTTKSITDGDVYEFDPADTETTLGFGSIQTKIAKMIFGVTYGIKYGTKYSNNGNLYNTDGENWVAYDGTWGVYNGSVAIDARNTVEGQMYYVPSDYKTKNYYFAPAGSYTVTFKYNDYAGKEATRTMPLTVKNTLFVPTLDITTRTVDSLDMSSIRKVIKADVDMNCNVADYDSIPETGDLLKTLTNTASGVGEVAQADNGKMTVKYIPVVEDGITYYIQINTTFKTE